MRVLLRRQTRPAFAAAISFLILATHEAPQARAECEDYSDRLHWKSSCRVPGTAMNIAIVESLAYVAASEGGVRVLDLGDPARPVEIGSVDTPGDATDIAVDGGYAFVADLFDGIQIIDIRNPKQPVIAGHLETLLPAVSVAVSGGYLYIGEARFPYYAPSKLEVADISSSTAPMMVASLTTPSWAWDIAISGDRAFVASEERGIVWIDISDPFEPEIVEILAMPGQAQGVALTVDHAFVADGDDGLQVARITEGAPFEIIGSTALPGMAYGVSLYGKYACVAAGMEGIQVVSVADPAGPLPIGALDTEGTAWGILVHDSFAYLADASSIEAFSLGTMPANVAPICALEGVNVADIAVSDSVACMACVHDDLQVYSVADPLHPIPLGSAVLPGDAEGVEIRGGFAYTANWSGGMSVIRISDPRHPAVMATVPIAGPAWDLDLAGPCAFIAANDLFVVDITDPERPAVVARLQTSSERLARRVAASGTVVYIADESAGLVVVDAAVPSSPQVVQTVPLGGGGYAVAVRGDHALATGLDGTLFVIDVTIPSEAAIVGSVSLNAVGNRIEVDGPFAYISTPFSEGVYVVEVSDPSGPAIVGEMVTPGITQGLTVSSGYLFLADQPFLSIGRTHCPSRPASAEATGETVDRGAAWIRPSPNPSSGSVRISFAAPLTGPVDLSIIDVRGRRVRRIQESRGCTREAGSAHWDGRDDGGHQAPGGTYFVVLRAAGVRRSSPLILLR